MVNTPQAVQYRVCRTSSEQGELTTPGELATQPTRPRAGWEGWMVNTPQVGRLDTPWMETLVPDRARHTTGVRQALLSTSTDHREGHRFIELQNHDVSP